eukprot:3270018-Prorocentrum_lima.AAC.1
MCKWVGTAPASAEWPHARASAAKSRGHPLLPVGLFWCVADVEVGEWGHGHHGYLVPAMWTEA